MTSKKKSGPKIAVEPQPTKTPSTGDFDPTTSGGTSMVWRLARMDLAGTWGWGGLVTDNIDKLHQVLSAFEAATPRKLRLDSQLREIPAQDLCAEAQQRLRDLKQDDVEGLAELRLGHQKWRVWGFLAGSIFDVLWWDPEHTVCQQLPKGKSRP